MDVTQEVWIAQFESDDNAIMLDVRTEEEYNNGIIPSAINIDIRQEAEFMEAIQALDPSKNYYVYCRSGMRSANACEIMKDEGIPNVFNLLGGILEWKGEIVSPD